MTLNIVGIDEDSTNPVDQFWTAAEHVLIQIEGPTQDLGKRSTL